MEHFFSLPVLFKGEEHNLQGRLATFGYVYKFYIMVEGRELVFEKDDERNYRVISEFDGPGKIVETELLKAVVLGLQQLNYEGKAQ